MVASGSPHPGTQACALTRNRTRDPLVPSPSSITELHQPGQECSFIKKRQEALLLPSGLLLKEALPTPIFQSQSLLGASGVLHPAARSHWKSQDGLPTPTSALQLNSGVSNPELAQNPQIKGSVLHNTTITSDARHALAVPICDQLTTNLGAHNPLSFYNLLEQSQQRSQGSCPQGAHDEMELTAK